MKPERKKDLASEFTRGAIGSLALSLFFCSRNLSTARHHPAPLLPWWTRGVQFHVEAARLLAFTEEEFLKTLDWAA